MLFAGSWDFSWVHRGGCVYLLPLYWSPSRVRRPDGWGSSGSTSTLTSPLQCLGPTGMLRPPLATAPPEGRAARSAKQTLGRARISWTGWRARAQRRARRRPGTGCAGRACASWAPARARPAPQLPQIRRGRLLLRGLETAGISPPRPRVLPLRGLPGGVAHLSSETPHVGRPGWGGGGGGKG